MTLIDYLGERHTVPGRVGMSLTEVCEKHGMDLLTCDASGGGLPVFERKSETWVKDLYGEGMLARLYVEARRPQLLAWWLATNRSQTGAREDDGCLCLRGERAAQGGGGGGGGQGVVTAGQSPWLRC